jgi:putative N6-adenine-specific DNA methylase
MARDGGSSVSIALAATAAFGLESLVELEVRELGFTDAYIDNGRVLFRADERGLARANLWLRCADRVLVQVGTYPASTFDELFEGCRALPWADWIPENGRFPVSGRSVKSKLHSVPDCQAIVKKAVVESLKAKHHLERFPETGPEFQIEVSLLEDIATLTLDTSGQALHKRGYRKSPGTAPLKETLAAGMVMISRWRPGRPFMDPFCGSGTIPVEAALMGLNIAPGLSRTFAAEGWPSIPAATWAAAREEARDLAQPGRSLDLRASDRDEGAIRDARRNADAAGVGSKIRFAAIDVRDIRPEGDFGCIVCNPSYGERLGDSREATEAYGAMRAAFRRFGTWSFFVITPQRNFERVFGRSADKRRRLFNGNILCTYYQFFGPLPPQRATFG